MFSELIKRCKAGDQIACRQFFLLYTLVPCVENLFRRLRTESGLIVLPRPRTPRDARELEDLLRERERFDQLLQQPLSCEDLPSARLRLEALRAIRQEWAEIMGELDAEIEKLNNSTGLN